MVVDSERRGEGWAQKGRKRRGAKVGTGARTKEEERASWKLYKSSTREEPISLTNVPTNLAANVL